MRARVRVRARGRAHGRPVDRLGQTGDTFSCYFLTAILLFFSCYFLTAILGIGQS